jgi:hypothetical protein
MGLGDLLTRSRLTYPEVSSKVCHDSFCQLENSVSNTYIHTCMFYYTPYASLFLLFLFFLLLFLSPFLVFPFLSVTSGIHLAAIFLSHPFIMRRVQLKRDGTW